MSKASDKIIDKFLLPGEYGNAEIKEEINSLLEKGKAKKKKQTKTKKL